MSVYRKILEDNEEEIKDSIRDYFSRFFDEDGEFDEVQYGYSSNDAELLVEIGEEYFGDSDATGEFEQDEYDLFFGWVDEILEEPEFEAIKNYE